MKIKSCSCQQPHQLKKIVLTGGPGAGKTAILETLKRELCKHIAVLPEAAGVVFGGGFLRRQTILARKAAQRAIYFVQRELETIIAEDASLAVVLCDRGTLDGLAYWPVNESLFWQELGTTREQELARYAAVIHLRVPNSENGYGHSNPLRIETGAEALEIDERIVAAWQGHPRRIVIESQSDFLIKVAEAAKAIIQEIPPCCRTHLKI